MHIFFSLHAALIKKWQPKCQVELRVLHQKILCLRGNLFLWYKLRFKVLICPEGFQFPTELSQCFSTYFSLHPLQEILLDILFPNCSLINFNTIDILYLFINSLYCVSMLYPYKQVIFFTCQNNFCLLWSDSTRWGCMVYLWVSRMYLSVHTLFSLLQTESRVFSNSNLTFTDSSR